MVISFVQFSELIIQKFILPNELMQIHDPNEHSNQKSVAVQELLPPGRRGGLHRLSGACGCARCARCTVRSAQGPSRAILGCLGAATNGGFYRRFHHEKSKKHD